MRRYANKIRATTFANYRKAITSKGLSGICKVQEAKIIFNNGSVIIPAGMDGNEESLKDTDADLVIYEEAQQSKRSHYTTLMTNLRKGQGGVKKSVCGNYEFKSKIIFAMNPPEDHEHYLVGMFDTAEEDPEIYPDIDFLRTTIDDNSYATEDNYARLEEIKQWDYNDYLRLRYGKSEPRTEGLFFIENKDFWFITEAEFKDATRYTETQQQIIDGKIRGTDEERKGVEEKTKKIRYLIHTYGGDFAKGVGRDALCLLDIYIDFENSKIFVKDVIFDNSIKKQDEIVEVMNERGVDKYAWQFWDNQYPMTIDYINRTGGFSSAQEADKPRILDALSTLSAFKIYICASETFAPIHKIKQHTKYLPLKKQIPKYSRMYDNKKECFKSEPETDASNMGIDFWDTLRYGVVTYVNKFNVKIRKLELKA